MIVTVKKLEVDQIPTEQSSDDVTEVFLVTDAEGNEHYRTDDVQAAKLAVKLSDSSAENDKSDQ